MARTVANELRVRQIQRISVQSAHNNSIERHYPRNDCRSQWRSPHECSRAAIRSVADETDVGQGNNIAGVDATAARAG
jgi:hypothetical protein